MTTSVSGLGPSVVPGRESAWPGGRAWLSTQAIIGRANYAAALVSGELATRSVRHDGLALARRVSAQRREFHKGLTDLIPPEQVDALDAAMVALARRCIEGLEEDAENAKQPTEG